MSAVRDALTNLANAFHEGRAVPLNDASAGYVQSLVTAAEAALSETELSISRWRWVDCTPHAGYFERRADGEWVKYQDLPA